MCSSCYSHCCFCTGSWGKCVCMSPLRADSPYPIALWFSWTQAPLVFKSRHCGDSSHWCRSQELRCLMWGTNPSLLMKKLHILKSLSIVGCHAKDGVFGKTMSLHLLPISMWLLYPLLWKRCSTSFQVLPRGNCFTCSCRFVVSVRGYEFRISLCYHFEPPPLNTVFIYFIISWPFTHLIISLC